MADNELEAIFELGEEQEFDCLFTIDAVTFDYDSLDNKPQINGEELIGDKSSSDLHLASEQGLIDEIENRQNADIEFANNLSELDSKVDGINANLTQQIEETQQDVNDKYNELIRDIDDLTDVVEEDYNTLNTRITNVANELQESIEENVVALQQEDTALQNQINVHSTTLTTYDTRITNNANAITQEVTNRQNADDALSDRIDVLEARGRFLALWNATTGLPESTPQITPYTYKTGDYYIVDAVGETNYRPTGTEFVEGQPSTEIETEELTTDDVYYYDGAVWRLQVNHGKTVSFGNLTGQPSDNTALKQALNEKQDIITSDNAGKNIIITTGSVIPIILLPEGYTQREFVGGNGNQWIDTGIAVSTLTNPTIETIFRMDAQADVDWFGTQNVNSPTILYNFKNGTAPAIYFRWGTTGNIASSLTFESGKSLNDFDFSNKMSKLKIDNNNGIPKYYVNDELVATQSTTPVFTNEQTICICRGRGFSTSSWQSFKISDNGVDLFDGVPCTRDSDGKGGMYDLITNKFIPSSGGELIVGDIVAEGLKISADLSSKQDTLVSGTNIKTLNNESLLGSGNIDITSAQWGNISGTLSNQTDLKNALDLKQNITDNNLVTTAKTVVGAVNELDAKIKDIQLYKFPNAIIIGQPTINNGQISGFSQQNYLTLPFLFDVGDRAFELNYAFRTSDNVTTAQNLFGSNYCIASYIQNGKLNVRVSSNGTSWDVVSLETSLNVLANTVYYIKIAFNKLNYTISASTDGTTYNQIGYVVNTKKPIAGNVFIGIGNNQNNPFLGVINLNRWDIRLNNSIIWEGMDDVGLATRADISLSNLDEQGEAKLGTQVIIRSW